jgi:hypothetical protein
MSRNKALLQGNPQTHKRNVPTQSRKITQGRCKVQQTAEKLQLMSSGKQGAHRS